jgi:hypothetical protein
MVMVLNGMIMAATMGSNLPLTANKSPTTLYNNERAKLNLMVVIESLAKRK